MVDKHSKHLGITNLDLYTEGAKFDFGLALQNKNLCIVSTHRLRPEYYGQPPNPKLLTKRAVKEAVHELEHCFGLDHCYNPRCAMHFSSGAIDTDRKSENFCQECQKQIRTRITKLSKNLNHPNKRLKTQPDQGHQVKTNNEATINCYFGHVYFGFRGFLEHVKTV